MSKRSTETENMDTKSDNEVKINLNSWLLYLFLLKDASTEESDFDSVKNKELWVEWTSIGSQEMKC